MAKRVWNGYNSKLIFSDEETIECDGNYWHNLPDNKKRDLKKEMLLKAEGYKLYRFTETEIKKDVSKCVAEVI